MPPETAAAAAAAPTVTIAVRDFAYIAPEILLAAWGLVVLLADVTLFRHAPGWRRQQRGQAQHAPLQRRRQAWMQARAKHQPRAAAQHAAEQALPQAWRACQLNGPGHSRSTGAAGCGGGS